ncbi:hypothetical protein WJ60_17620 [Burkholderia ubonensis]|nr:hypothetical protein WJ60_17620 [Burkholderia ubonensis]KVT45690.1 hypothetical protein WK51_03090 [Burkholderia ubonensis]KVX76474.1 hypothetical protein WL08_15390 [Burkholderia ubonensis]
MYLQFESNSSLGVKWSHEVYVEIHRAHLVDADKIDEVRKLRIPMVEVTIPDSLLYEHGDAGTTDEREQAYRQRIKHMLESEKGFLQAVVLSNPSSVEYLEGKLAETRSQLQVAAQRVKTTVDELASMRVAEQGMAKKLAEAEAIARTLRSEVTDADQRANDRATEVKELNTKLSNLSTSVTDLREKSRKLQIALGVMGMAAAALLAGCLASALHS